MIKARSQTQRQDRQVNSRCNESTVTLIHFQIGLDVWIETLALIDHQSENKCRRYFLRVSKQMFMRSIYVINAILLKIYL